MANSWQTIGFKTKKPIHVIECKDSGNILYAYYIGEQYLTELTKDEIEEELF